LAGYPLIQKSSLAVLVAFDPAARLTAFAHSQNTALRPNALASVLKVPVIEINPANDDKPFILDDGLISKIASFEKKSLIIAGALLEGAVTQVSIATLLEGFDVFLCRDLCETDDKTNADIFINRIRDCGAHIVTQQQIVLEVLAQCKDAQYREALESFLSSGP